MQPLPIIREGSYHAEKADADNPSATSVRNLMQQNLDWNAYVAPAAADVFADAPLHAPQAGERAILGRLRTMTDVEFEALPYGSEGLWRKFMHACRSCATLEEIIAATKSKRYTRTRIDRMIMCAFLGISAETLTSPVPYTRVLAFNDTGRTVLKEAKNTGTFLNAGESADHPYWDLEKRCGDLYGLFCTDSIAAPGVEESRRVYYHKENP
jgi:predicted nucleotidyltransferase